MRALLCFFLAVSLSRGAEALPAGVSVAELRVVPAEVVLRRSTEYVQLLVTAQLSTGVAADVTRMVAVAGGEALVNVSGNGLVRGKADGAGELVLTVGEKAVKVPVRVENFAAPLQVDYIRDCMPVLSKAGCNAGTCHGSKEGKAGFKLSLRGYDPIYDVRAFTDDAKGRRTSVASPDDSLMLLKATGAVPHEGQQVVTTESDYYRILRAWIADGVKLHLETPRVTKIELSPVMPVIQLLGDRQQMRVVATYADGLVKDVTAEAFIDSGNSEVLVSDKTGLTTAVRRGEAAVLARFEGNYASTVITVMGDRSGFVWEAPPANNEIDRFVNTKLERMKTSQSGICTDEEFVRRIYLDLTGLPPMPDEIGAFLADGRDSRWKRDALIDKLIGSEDWVEQWSNKWADLLQVNGKFLGGEGAALFRNWIRAEVKANTPYDQFVRKILTATGSNKDNPPASYFKILREPAELMENTTHLFLATRFNCNKCHDHPFERWTQDQYYQMTAYFARVGLSRDPASGDRNLGGTAVEGAKPLYELVVDKNDGEAKHERTGALTPPKFPYPATPVVLPAPEGREPTRREELAKWITSPDNSYFAKSFTNRIFGYLTGTGLIEPLDDIRAGNPPSNPELLDWLTKQFVEGGFDVRKLMRLICQSRVYQLSIVSNQWNEDDQINYSRGKARRLPSETLYDTIFRVTGSTSNLPGVAPGTRSAALQDSQANPADGFLINLGRPVRESACECERSADLQMGPVMALISGPTVGEAISQPNNAIAKLATETTDDTQLVQAMFLRFLGRPANSTEVNAALETMGVQEAEHQEILVSLKNYEGESAAHRAALDQQRLDNIATAKAALAQYEVEVPAKVAAAEQVRQQGIAAAQQQVTEQETALATQQGEWEKTLANQTPWASLDPAMMTSTVAGVTLQKEADQSIFVSGAEGKQDYTVTAPVAEGTLTGIRLEALTDPRIGGNGPGRSGGGNFVLTEFEMYLTPANGAEQKIAFKDARATFSQGGFDVKGAIDGQGEAEANGWAIFPDIGKPQTAIFFLKDPLGVSAGGGTLRFVMKQRYTDGKHSLGRFRIGTTPAGGDLNFGLSQELVAALAAPAEQRSDPQKIALTTYHRSHDPEWIKRTTALGMAQQPLPADPQLAALKQGVASAELPVPPDTRLARLQQDATLSAQQLTTRRLTGAQDLAWALINSSAFLFNR